MASIELDLDHEINRTVSHLPGVRASVRSEADKIEAKAQANLAAHRDVTTATDHAVTSEQDGVDALVSLEGPAPASVEWGHWYTGNLGGEPKYVPGLYIITKASGII